MRQQYEALHNSQELGTHPTRASEESVVDQYTVRFTQNLDASDIPAVAVGGLISTGKKQLAQLGLWP